MYKRLFSTLFTLTLVSCGGVLVYDNSGQLFVGPLAKDNLNEMKSTGQVHSKASHDDMQYAIDRSGTFIGVCRTTFHQPENPQTNQREVPGEMDFHLFNVFRQEQFSTTNTDMIRKIDSFASSNFEDVTEDHAHRYLHCFKMGASNANSRLVLYFQPQGFEDTVQNLAVEIDVSGDSFTIVDHEFFSIHGNPSTVVARDNPLKGNTVGILSNRIAINSVSVQLNNNPVRADSVKHHFE